MSSRRERIRQHLRDQAPIKRGGVVIDDRQGSGFRAVAWADGIRSMRRMQELVDEVIPGSTEGE